ncbi:hypothetical protein V6N12_074373 [Hibiscus sabdariffa]|uniref:Uncharacterized protein n=1 Tax=Hibiscus sabdariffa TaxID=183260 RepID=A0ABR2BKX8_9ROSI
MHPYYMSPSPPGESRATKRDAMHHGSSTTLHITLNMSQVFEQNQRTVICPEQSQVELATLLVFLCVAPRFIPSSNSAANCHSTTPLSKLSKAPILANNQSFNGKVMNSSILHGGSNLD